MASRQLALVALAMGLAFGSMALAADSMLVVGHKNPDTDAIVAALAVAHLKSKQGIPAQAIAQGAPNAETRYVLERFKLKAPPVQATVAGRQVFLVDHSDYALAPDDLKTAEVVGLADHHKLGGLTTDKPIEVWLFPVGSSATVVARMYAAADQPVPQELAGALLAAILSDTVVFRSPTTTPEDRSTATRLASIAGVNDIHALGLKLFEIKSDLGGMPPMQLLKQDLKDFTMGGRKLAVAQLEVMDIGTVMPRKEELLAAMGELKRDGYSSVLLMVTDVMKEGTEMLVVTDDAPIVESALGAKVQDNSVWLPGVMSRKKQVIPGLEKAFSSDRRGQRSLPSAFTAERTTPPGGGVLRWVTRFLPVQCARRVCVTLPATARFRGGIPRMPFLGKATVNSRLVDASMWWVVQGSNL